MISTITVFDFDDYRKFLQEKVGPGGTRRGIRLAAAHAIGCHSSYLTKILDGNANLSLEQTLKLGQFFKMPPDESEFLLYLVQRARAGTTDLLQYFDTKVREIRSKRRQLKERVSIKKNLSREDQAAYYSSWHFAAIHVALTISELQTRKALADFFGIPETKVAEVLRFLVSANLVREKAGRYEAGQTQLHLAGDSPNISKHHTNWRTRAIVSLDHRNDSDLHYSAVASLSRKNADLLREKLVTTIRELALFVSEGTKEEEVFAIGFDWFNLKRES
jgi:uncharacterized protein (TIGR02147 family)